MITNTKIMREWVAAVQLDGNTAATTWRIEHKHNKQGRKSISEKKKY